MYPIRILHMLHSMNRGGAENALMNYYRHIDREKVQFDFILTDPNPCQFETEILEMGGKVYRVPMLTMKNPLPYFRGVSDFLSLHSEYKIIHSHTSSKSVFPLWIAKWKGVPVRISHSHNTQSESGVRGLIRDGLMKPLKWVATDLFSCGIQAGYWLYGKKAVENGNVRIINNVIEADRYRLDYSKRKTIRRELGLDDDVLLVGHVARFDYQKNHLFDVDILFELKKMGLKVKLITVGLGVKEGLSKYALKKGVLNDIIFTGVVDNVWDYEQAMDAFILPSFYEGLPLSIIEAQVSGLPCFTSEGRVSKECSVTNLVSYIPLEAGPEVWAKKIAAFRTVERTDRFQEIVDASYDAQTSAKKLQDFYLQKYERHTHN